MFRMPKQTTTCLLRKPVTTALSLAIALALPVGHTALAQNDIAEERKLPVILVVGERRQDALRQPGAYSGPFRSLIPV